MQRDWFIVDAHQHIEVGNQIYASRPPKDTIEKLPETVVEYFRKWFEKYNVAYGAVSNISPMVDRVWLSHHGGNEAVVELMKRLEGKVIGQYVPNIFEAPELVREKTEEAVGELGFKGIKLHPWVSAFPLSHPMVYAVFDVAAKHRVSVLSHSSRSEFCTPLLFAEIAQRYPDVPVIMGHMGKQHLHFDVLPTMRLAQNIYLETSGSKLQILLERAVKEFGAERVLFGTDGPGDLLLSYVVRIEDLNVSETEKEWILGKSAAKVFGLP